MEETQQPKSISEAGAIGSGVFTWWDKKQQEDEIEASHLLDELPVVDLTGRATDNSGKTPIHAHTPWC